MSTIILRKRMTTQEKEDLIRDMTEWFKNNPRRKICNVGDSNGMYLFKIRKNHIRDDVERQG